MSIIFSISDKYLLIAIFYLRSVLDATIPVVTNKKKHSVMFKTIVVVPNMATFLSLGDIYISCVNLIINYC